MPTSALSCPKVHNGADTGGGLFSNFIAVLWKGMFDLPGTLGKGGIVIFTLWPVPQLTRRQIIESTFNTKREQLCKE